MNRLIAAAFAAFFVFAAHAQEVPIPKPAEKAAPACYTITKFFAGKVEYVERTHKNFPGWRFAFVKRDEVIVIFKMNGPCLQGYSIKIRKAHPHFQELFEMVFESEQI